MDRYIIKFIDLDKHVLEGHNEVDHRQYLVLRDRLKLYLQKTQKALDALARQKDEEWTKRITRLRS